MSIDAIVGDNTPVPMTASQVLREVESLRALLETRLNAMDKAVAVFHDDLVRVPTEVDRRVEALKEATSIHLDHIKVMNDLMNERTERIPIEYRIEIQALKEVILQMLEKVDTRFNGIQTELSLRDERVRQASVDTKSAIDSAFQAAEKAVQKQTESSQKAIDKAEKSTEDSISQLRILIQTTSGGLNGKIDDLKERVARIESMKVGASEVVTSNRQDTGFIISMIALGLSVLGFGANIVFQLIK